MLKRWLEFAGRPHRAEFFLRVAALAFFVWLTGRFWHPHYGFTKFLLLDTQSATMLGPELRAAPLYTYQDGYDGHYYAQLAARPLVNDPALAVSIDNVGYRARRILLSWLGWAAGWGEPVAAVRAFAWLNLVLWFGLAALLWKLFPLGSWRGAVAWGGLLFSAGVLHSVRLALTDLLAFGLVAWAVWQIERGRHNRATGLLALAALARETALLGAVALVPTTRLDRPNFLRAAFRILCVPLPLIAWIFYLNATIGRPEPGLGNFMWPLSGWLGKGGEAWANFGNGTDRWLAITTLLAHVALTVQLGWLAVRPGWADRWWRVGAVYGVMALFLGTAVWEGHPGAAVRVLLPLGLAFNVLAVRSRASAWWLVTGNLSVLSGVLVLWAVPVDAHELAAGRSSPFSYVAHTDATWYPRESGGGQAWAWSSGGGAVEIETWPRISGVRSVQVRLRAIGVRPVEIRQGDTVLWSGELGERARWIDLPVVRLREGRAVITITSAAPPWREGDGGRELSFALYGLRVDGEP